MNNPVWQTLDRFVEIQSPWVTLIGEHLRDDQGQTLAYWRVERADSVVVLPLWQGHLLLPQPMYRPGVGRLTLDFPGGRRTADQSPEAVAVAVLGRELGVPPAAVQHLQALNPQGWPVNSSFSNQMLYGFVAELAAEAQPAAVATHATTHATTYAVTEAGLEALLQDLTCLQCRALLLEWRRQAG